MKNDEVKSANANLQASAISTIVLGFAADPMARWARTPSRSAIERYFKSSGWWPVDCGTPSSVGAQSGATQCFREGW